MVDTAFIERALDLFRAGKSYRQIGGALGVSRQYVHQTIGHLIGGAARLRKCRSCGAQFQMKTNQAYCASCAAKRRSETSLAAAFGTCECGRKKRKRSRRCWTCHFADSCDVDLAVALYERGYSAAHIGVYFGRTTPAIYKALHRGGRRPGHANRARAAYERQARIPIEQAAAGILKQRAARKPRRTKPRALNQP